MRSSLAQAVAQVRNLNWGGGLLRIWAILYVLWLLQILDPDTRGMIWATLSGAPPERLDPCNPYDHLINPSFPACTPLASKGPYANWPQTVAYFVGPTILLFLAAVAKLALTLLRIVLCWVLQGFRASK